MCWDDSEFGGFSEAQPWIKPHSMVKELNLKNDLAAEKSVFRFYQKLLALRSGRDALTLGDVQFLSKEEDNHLLTLRTLGDERILVVCNFEQPQTITTDFAGAELLLSNYADRQTSAEAYRPFEIAVYRL